MKSETADLSQVMDSLDAIRQELTRLNQRVVALEAGAKKRMRPPPRPELAKTCCW